MNEMFHIMVVDDDSTLTQSIEYLLHKKGFIVTTANSGQEAITLLKGGLDPDIILLDVRMPHMDGYQTFNEISRIKSFPIMFVTGDDDTETELKGLTMGAVDFVTKPFMIDILVARINIHIGKARQLSNYHDLVKKNNKGEIIGRVVSMGETDTLSVALDQDKLDSMKDILSDSEYRVGKRIALGYTNKEIADELNFSYSYVKKVAYNIFEKLKIKKRTELRSFFTK